MKKILLLTLALSSHVFLTSCEDDEVVSKDVVNPNISLITPATTDVLRGVVSIKAEIEELNLQNVKILVDGNQIHESKTNSVDFLFDTKTVEDGTHLLKILALDKDNNRSESEVQIEVFNTLVALSVPYGYVTENKDVWLFLSDNAGNVIDAKQAINGKTITFETPENYKKDQTFVLNEFVSHKKEVEGKTTYLYDINSYTEFTTGKLFFKTPAEPKLAIGGEVSFTATGLTNNYNLNIIGTDVKSSNSSFSGSTYSSKTQVYKDITNILYTLTKSTDRTSAPLYKFFSNVSVGSEVSTDMIELEIMNMNTISLPGTVASSSSKVIGYNQAGYYADGVTIFSENNNNNNQPQNMRVCYPGTIYPEYLTSLSYTSGNENRTYYKVGAVPATEFKSLTQIVLNEFKIENKIGNIKVAGNIDLLSTSAYVVESESSTIETIYSWNIFMPASTSKFHVPQLPKAITDKYAKLSRSFSFTQVTGTEYTGINGYNDYKQILFQSEDELLDRTKEYMSLSYSFGSGVRKK
jgi:hypothetical protein